MKSTKGKSGLSESCVVGVIALVFLIIGYQTALFVHQAAVTEIAANRDEPDTVFVHIPVPSVKQPEMSSPSPVTVRKNTSHSPRAQAVRDNVKRKHVESFPFDPNTVSVEDLTRLGFSPKQAQSIDNYRSKGGRFRRKSDFARSFVVSDSVYKRLEPYIDIPLIDLNLADSADFDALPGIGGWYASRMIEYRERLGSYSYKEQLMDIYRFDEEKYEGLSDLVTVSPSYVKVYPLWTLPADSLRRHPYIDNYETARSIVLFRDSNPEEMWTVEALEAAGILTADAAEKLSRCALEVL
jgi:DNA uptake protein ComE-like DNA-binding protein